MTADIRALSAGYPSGAPVPSPQVLPKAPDVVQGAAPSGAETGTADSRTPQDETSVRTTEDGVASQTHPAVRRFAESLLDNVQDSLETVAESVRTIRDLSAVAGNRRAEGQLPQVAASSPAGGGSGAEGSAERSAGNAQSAGAAGSSPADRQTSRDELLQGAEEHLRQIDNAGKQITEQIRQLQATASPLAGTLEVSVDTSRLGRIETGPGEAFALSDFIQRGPDGIFDNVAVSDAVAAQALTQLSVMRNEVENFRSGVLAANGGLGGGFALGAAQAQALLGSVQQSIQDSGGTQAMAAASGRLNREGAVRVLLS